MLKRSGGTVKTKSANERKERKNQSGVFCIFPFFFRIAPPFLPLRRMRGPTAGANGEFYRLV